jgi:hypothetical protein
MKKLLLATLLIGMMGGCTEQKDKVIKFYECNGHIIESIKIDSCEYLMKTYDGYFTHKGNCSNPIHKGGNK